MSFINRYLLITIACFTLFAPACGGEDDPPEQCNPETCGSLRKDCGSHFDGCGGTLDCGTCEEGYDCEDGTCVAEPEPPDPPCVPDRCGDLGYNCGTHPDGCGDMLDCGTCERGFHCDNGQCVQTCVPDTCASLGFECGSHPDGCGSSAHCGSCGTGYECQGGLCVISECAPETCFTLDVECGYHPDGCGGTLDCGNCPSGLTCNDGICECTPHTCSALGRECGEWDDGCGGVVDCGSCGENEVCRFDGRCIGECIPKTCESVNANCGMINDGCGGTVNCGVCPGGQICGGEGPNRCGDVECSPKTCAMLGFQCGSHSDGCGNIITCGPCASNERCDSQYQCVSAGSADGEPCTQDSDCAGQFCITYDDYGWHNGHCTGTCVTDGDCSQGAFCSSLGLCMVACSRDNNCRSEGYMCKPDTDGSGMCWPGATGSGEVGDACTGYWECGGREHGTCVDAWPNGYCTIFCGTDEGSCSGASECYDFSSFSICLASCFEIDDCRANHGYACENLGGIMSACIPGCTSDDDCQSPTAYCDTDSHTCVQCINNAHCPGTQTCHEGWCETDPTACHHNGFNGTVHHAHYAETGEGPLLAYYGLTSENYPHDDLGIEWWFDWGANYTGPGVYPVETNSNLETCGLCIDLIRRDATGQTTKVFFAIEGEVEITAIGGDGDPFSGVIRDLVLVEWSANDTAVQNGERWCIDNYSWTAELFGDIPQPGCTSNNDCTNPAQPICNTATGTCVQCTSDAHCQGTDTCTNNICVSQGPGQGESGDTCEEDNECTGSEAFCITETISGWEGGYCTQENCNNNSDCAGGVCIENYCYASCTNTSDCRDGYGCLTQSEVCFPYSDGSGNPGAPCSNHRDCKGGYDGICFTDIRGFPGGYCTSFCDDHSECSGNGICVTSDSWGAYGRCLDGCFDNTDCTRSGYSCHILEDGFGACWPENEASNVIVNESLRTGSIPSGWTGTNIDWKTSGDGYAHFTHENSELRTKILDFSGYSNVTLEFDVAKWGTGVDGPITVQVSDNGGSTWTAQTFDSPVPTDANYVSSGPTQITATGNQVMIRFIRTNSPSQKRLRDVIIRAE